jgi:hypothetical protein
MVLEGSRYSPAGSHVKRTDMLQATAPSSANSSLRRRKQVKPRLSRREKAIDPLP